ncbi:hypothetical protein [Cognataquiflexum rubidum]|uniref:hypothetical protein n=1 Tax=Cognataquiflexum rubidum TaxID=2922273 RepID=UPI001F136A39|nr:hypothetical protein [Cognataquiflexum rubidum]MCH6236786.1 hypothetical protein [Cognataquiflexum rubidum]
MNWIFKTGDYIKTENDGQRATITFEQKRNFTGKEGEDVLILEKRRSEWQFISHFSIVKIEVKNQEAENKEITISLALVKLFKEEKLLEDYIYSLRRITNYSYPIKHFSRKYSRLFDAEFEAIVEDKIYLKRTILGTILNAMHSEHQKAYINYVALESPELLTGKSDMDKALELLLQYLDFAVIKPAQYLKESVELLKNIVSDEEIEQIGFAEDIERQIIKSRQMLKPQVDLINQYLGELFQYNNEARGIRMLELEDNFKSKSLFKNSPLPITLK